MFQKYEWTQRWGGSAVDTMNGVSHQHKFITINSTLTDSINPVLIRQRDVHTTDTTHSRTRLKGDSLTDYSPKITTLLTARNRHCLWRSINLLMAPQSQALSVHNSFNFTHLGKYLRTNRTRRGVAWWFMDITNQINLQRLFKYANG